MELKIGQRRRALDAPSVNIVTCDGQATIPIVAAVSSVATVHYAEVVASTASKSAGQGTRANIDEFSRTMARGIEEVGGAVEGKAIIILNPAEPLMLTRDTVFTLLGRHRGRRDSRSCRGDSGQGERLRPWLSAEAQCSSSTSDRTIPFTFPALATSRGSRPPC